MYVFILNSMVVISTIGSTSSDFRLGKPLGSQELRDYVTDTSPNGWGKEYAEIGRLVLDYLENTYTSRAWA